MHPREIRALLTPIIDLHANLIDNRGFLSDNTLRLLQSARYVTERLIAKCLKEEEELDAKLGSTSINRDNETSTNR